MGDTRFSKAYERVRAAGDRARAIRALTDDEVIQALGAASRDRDPFLANVLATEAQNRITRSRTITQHLAEGTFSTDERLRITYANPAMISILGGQADDYVGHELEDVLIIRDASGNRLTGTPACALRRALEGEGVIEFEGSIERHHHDPVPVSIIVGPIERDGRIEGTVAALRDVRERRTLEDELAKASARLATALLSLSEGVLVLSPEGRIVEANDAAARILGHTRDELIARSRENIVREVRALDGRVLPRAEHPILRALTMREPVLDARIRTDTPHMGERILRVSAVPVKGNGVVVTFSDVSEDHARELALRYERRLLDELIETIPVGVLVADASGRIIHHNRASRAIWGDAPMAEGPADRRGHRARDPRTGEPIPAEDWALARALRTRTAALDQDMLIEDVRGERRRILNSAIPLHDADGQVRRYVVLNVDLTERMEAERQREALLDAALDAIITIDEHGKVEAWNAAAETMFGYSRAEAIGKELAELVVPERFRRRHREGVRRVATAAAPTPSRLLGRRYILPAIRKDGSEFDAEISIVHVPGDRARFTGFVRSVTEEGPGAHRGILAEGQYEAIVEKIPDHAIFHVGLDGTIQSWNEGCRRIKGYQEREFIGLPFAALFPPEARARGEPEAELAEAFEKGHLHKQSWRVRKDGTPFLADVDLTLLRNASGEPAGFVKITHDLTERLAVGSRLRTREEQHAVVARLGQAALEGRPVAEILDLASEELRRVLEVEYTKILQLDADGRTLTMRAGKGWGPEVGAGTTRVSAGLDSQAGYALTTQGPVIVEDLPAETRFHPTPFLVAHGVRSGMSVMILGPTRPWGVLGVHTRARRAFTEDDVHFLQSVANVLATAIRQAEGVEALERRVHERTHELQQANRDLEAFTNTASHDLRAPLRGIGMLADDLEQALARGDHDEAKELAQLIRREDDKAIRLVRALLGFAQSGRQDLHPVTVDVTALADDVVADIRRRHPDRRARFEIARGITARADPALLRIVLDNLLSNASKYSDRTPDPQVQLSADASDDETILHIRDNGVGFPQDEAARLFVAFQRLSTARGYEGTGLGLAAVHRVVRRHGGRIWADSSIGQGAAFHVALPRREGPRSGEGQRRYSEAQRSGEGHGHHEGQG